jgi:hypothetical protein
VANFTPNRSSSIQLATAKMWKLSACYLFSTAVLINYTLAVLTLNIVRGPQYNQGVDTQRIKGRATITATLNNNVTGGAYYVEVDVGTPAQRQRLVVDTGSSDTWILDSKADLCTVPRIQESSFGGCETTCMFSRFKAIETLIDV